MKILLIVSILLCLAGVLPVSADENPCWECWDCLQDCESHVGKECCVKAKKECCKDCRDFRRYYNLCLYRTDEKERYSDHSTKRLQERFRQRFMDEMDGMIE